MDGCIFCMIGRGEIPSQSPYEDDDCKVIMDLAPASAGHCLIIPKKHAGDIYELDPETGGKLFQLAIRIAPAIKVALRCDGLNIIQNNGKAAGQTVGHFHMHLIPRYAGMDVSFFNENNKAAPEELKRLAESIKAAL